MRKNKAPSRDPKAKPAGVMRSKASPATKKGSPKPRKPALSIQQAPPPAKKAPPPIVGIGASAGGLEALEQFLKAVPVGSGMAFVIVQHLDPTRKGIMVELLQRSTGMKVLQVRDRMKAEPDHVYVIPPNKDMSILGGVLHLLDPMTPRGLRLPIDFFFRSLAADRQEQSLGVILSGMGSDGTLGLRAIKEKGGGVFVQAPASAKFDSMPCSAIDAGLADMVAPVEELPEKILAYLRHVPVGALPGVPLAEKAQSALEKAFILLRAQTGHDFSLYKRSTIHRRIERRMGIHQLRKISQYVRLLQESPHEAELLFKELLIGVTSFFRDAEAWKQVKGQVLSPLLAARPEGGVLRAWVSGCSTGEEAYSLAMVFKEAVEQVKPVRPASLQIFATDLDRDAIEKARAGIYPDNIAADVPPERLRRFFDKQEHGYKVGKEIREMVIFAAQNVIMDPPFTKLDLLSCRNLLIYLGPELQQKLLPIFHYSLNPGGVLFLGSAESVGACANLFAPLDGKARLYRRIETSPRAEPVTFPPRFLPPPPEGQPARPKVLSPASNLSALANQVVLQRYAPASVLVNREGDILTISGRTGKYLEPAAGKANWNIHAMAREGLRDELGDALSQAVRKRRTITLKGLQVGTESGVRVVDTTVHPLEEPEALRGTVLVVFAEAPAAGVAQAPGKGDRGAPRDARGAKLERDLRVAREEAQTTREEMQTSQEELTSANEELQSTNEELQSTNEELTTSKEEMQSLNEELQTINHELQAKVEELSRANNDMKNLLNSTDIATLFLDEGLLIRRFTTQAAKLMKLIPGDVGRPITDIASQLIYPELASDTREVLRTLAVAEKTLAAGDGRWFMARIMPYRTTDNRIDGVVATFRDITDSKKLEKSLREVQAGMELHIAAQNARLEEVADAAQRGASPFPPRVAIRNGKQEKEREE